MLNAGLLSDSKSRLLGATCLIALVACGCGDNGESGGAEILPHQSPASFGEMYPLGNSEADPTGNVRTPYEWVLLLQSTGDAPLEISEVCLVGDEDDGSDVDQFTLEVEGQETPATVEVGAEFGLRLTYDRQQPNEGDDADQVAVVVQSNADNYPTLVVPVCARVVGDGQEQGTVECQSPVTVEEGESDTSLCD